VTSFRQIALSAPTVQTVNIRSIELVSGRVVSARTIQIYGLSGCQYPDEARHLRSGGAFVNPQFAKILANEPVDIEWKNAGI
jgi:hypothetical protein